MQDQLIHNTQVYPVTIIGGGLAGSAAATVLARAGHRVAVLEKDAFPRDKLCGEFLSGESKRMLSDLGCLAEILRHEPPEIHQARFIGTNGNCVTVPLPEPALGLSRRLLDEVLFRTACEMGAKGYTGCEVIQIEQEAAGETLIHMRPSADRMNSPVQCISAQITIAAYGRRSKLDRDLNRNFLHSVNAAVGYKLHHIFRPGDAGSAARRELSGTTEIYGLPGGYCGVNLVEGDKVNVCLLLLPETLRRINSASWQQVVTFMAESNPSLGTRLQAMAAISDKPLTVAGMPFQTKDTSGHNVMFIGDAAGMIAPLCGDGQAMALESGISAAKSILELFPDGESIKNNPAALQKLCNSWSHQWRAQYQRRIRLGRWLQSALLRPAIGNTAISLLRHTPGATAYLASRTRGHSSHYKSPASA